MVINLYAISGWKQLRVDRSVVFSVFCSDTCYTVTSQYQNAVYLSVLILIKRCFGLSHPA